MCPECGTQDAQQLLLTIRCSNNKCKHYDVKHEIQVTKNRLAEVDKQITSLEKQKKVLKSHLQNLGGLVVEDPFDSAIKAYLQRKLQIDMVQELNGVLIEKSISFTS